MAFVSVVYLFPSLRVGSSSFFSTLHELMLAYLTGTTSSYIKIKRNLGVEKMITYTIYMITWYCCICPSFCITITQTSRRMFLFFIHVTFHFSLLFVLSYSVSSHYKSSRAIQFWATQRMFLINNVECMISHYKIMGFRKHDKVSHNHNNSKELNNLNNNCVI